MEYRRLGNTDMEVSKLSFGGSSLGAVFREIDEKDGIQAVYNALDAGINYLDTSPFYGLTLAETRLGKALKEVPRDQYYLATKCGRYGDKREDFDYSHDRIIQSAYESMERLGVDYLDVLQLHDSEYYGRETIEQALNEGIPALQELKQKGVIRYYGLASYPIELFQEAAERVEYDTILCHNHYSLNDTRLLELLPLVKEKGMALINASPLSSGVLTKRGTASWHPATEEDLSYVKKAVKLCEENGTSLEKLAIQFSTANPDIPTTLLSTASAERMNLDIKWIDEPLNEDLVAKVQDILQPIFNKEWDYVAKFK